MATGTPSEFEEAAAGEGPPGLFSEFWDFLRHNKKWWLLPILITLAAVAALAFLSAGPAGPFLYTLF
jgi:hypothetical protein